MSEADRGALRAMVNLDVVGLPADLKLIGTDDLIDTARIAASGIGVEAARSTLPQGASSDHVSFQDAGVPVVMLYRDDDQIHTPADAIGRIDPASLRQTVSVAIATLSALNGG
jgi:Zn-dependent M28 family amino/carboxypeptidase